MNKEFLTEAYLKSTGKLRAIAGRILGSSENVDDMLQEAFLRLWQRKESLRNESHAEGALAITVKNLSIDTARDNLKYQVTGLEDAEWKEDSPDCDAEEAADRVDRALRRVLSERDREILYRRERDGWEMDEIAEHFGLTEVNVRSIISRGRKAVRNYLTSSDNEQ